MIIISSIFALFTFICMIGLIMCILDKDIIGCLCFTTMIIIMSFGSIQSYQNYESKNVSKSTLDINTYKSINQKTDTIYIKIK